ncbi:hypothetical protein RSal33209_2563 [Renibacterium salmoninarum ATCC 33209]|uniref:Uncharacterized protein n=1 Tax=Renibacterium salmoninarum (strain ATCC 33209 / DSM 20767 / JCM 11484 / NBRC 15589 / NCIMB 2235) TaxID=288705 RepID=A9WRK7_RENSM|nr:hypothetical protein RSal33209_2563 [Renibacterium salmoninarum ATCC 33209]
MQRLDINGQPIETWNGTNWISGRLETMIFSNGGFSWGANSSWDAGTLSVDSSAGASSQQLPPVTPFSAPGSLSGTLKFLIPGIYDIRWYHAPDREVGNGGYRINISGTWPGPPDAPNGISGHNMHMNGASFYETQIDANNLVVPQANLEIRFTGAQNVAATCVPRIKVTLKQRL